MNKSFRIRIFDPKPLIWWNNKKNSIDMEPPYQRRGRLWAPADKAYLIDSIINGYDIPKLYIADFTWGDSALNNKKLPYAIIDGKQRFEAIFDFFSGDLVLNDDFVYLDNPNIKLAGLGYKDLLMNYVEIAEDFQNFTLMVMGVYAQDEKPIKELFVRLNRSKALTGAEIRNAMAGPAPEIIRQIANHDFFTVNVNFEVKRGQDLNAAAKLLLFEYFRDFQDTKKENLDNFVLLARKNPREILELSGRKVIENLDSMSLIFLPNDGLLNSAGILPVYYWLIREIEDKYFPRFREFINLFEKERRDNRANIRKNPENGEIRNILIEYDNFNRSTNNDQSHRERYRILKNSFDSYLKTGTF
jgi:hypothetical protein